MYSQEHYQTDSSNEWQTISCSRHYPDSAVRASARGEEERSTSFKKEEEAQSRGEGSIFILAWGTFPFCSVSEYRMHCLISVPLQLSCPNSNLLWFMWLRSCFLRSHLTMKRVYVSRCWGASISDKQLLFTPTETHTEDTRPATARRRKYLRKSIIYIDTQGLTNDISKQMSNVRYLKNVGHNCQRWSCCQVERKPTDPVSQPFVTSECDAGSNLWLVGKRCEGVGLHDSLLKRRTPRKKHIGYFTFSSWIVWHAWIVGVHVIILYSTQ